jgi:hypothetical protein
MISEIFYFYLISGFLLYCYLIVYCVKIHISGCKDVFIDDFLGDKQCLN